MKLSDFTCINNNVDLDDYLKLYKYVIDNMKNKEWLGTFTKEEIKDILSLGGKIWLYYDEEILVCSMFYIPSNQKTLDKRKINTKSSVTASLGPIMVSPNYIGNKLMSQMLEVFNDYCKSIGMKYIFTKAHSNNIYSINNMYKDNYELIESYTNERGQMSAFLKKL